MTDDMIHIVPAEEQSAEEVAEILSKVAQAQGLQDEVHVEGGEVVVPRSLNVTFQGNPRSFPPVNQQYTLAEPVMLLSSGGSADQGSSGIGALEGFNVIVNQSK